jgi:hypothetical protein
MDVDSTENRRFPKIAVGVGRNIRPCAARAAMPYSSDTIKMRS